MIFCAFFKKKRINQTKLVAVDPQLIVETQKNEADDYDIMNEMTRLELYKAIDRLSKPRERYALLAELTGKSADDIAEEEKTRRLNEIIALQGEIALENNRLEVGKEYEVLVEGESHRSKEQLFGRNSQNKVIVFDKRDAVSGTYRRVRVTDCTAATLLGELV